MILITGATGFIGGEVTKLLINRGERVRLFVRDEKKARGLFPGADVVKGDFADKKSIRKAMKGMKIVMHFAGMVSYKAKWDDLQKANVLTAKNLLTIRS